MILQSHQTAKAVDRTTKGNKSKASSFAYNCLYSTCRLLFSICGYESISNMFLLEIMLFISMCFQSIPCGAVSQESDLTFAPEIMYTTTSAILTLFQLDKTNKNER